MGANPILSLPTSQSLLDFKTDEGSQLEFKLTTDEQYTCLSKWAYEIRVKHWDKETRDEILKMLLDQLNRPLEFATTEGLQDDHIVIYWKGKKEPTRWIPYIKKTITGAWDFHTAFEQDIK